MCILEDGWVAKLRNENMYVLNKIMKNVLFFSIFFGLSSMTQAATLEFELNCVKSNDNSEVCTTYTPSVGTIKLEDSGNDVKVTVINNIGGKFKDILLNFDPAITDVTLFTDSKKDDFELNSVIMSPWNTILFDLVQLDSMDSGDSFLISAKKDSTIYDLSVFDFKFLSSGLGTSLYASAHLQDCDTQYVDNPCDGDSLKAGSSVGEVPLPAAVWLFGSAFAGLMGVARKRTKVA